MSNINEKDLIWQQLKFSTLLEACSHAINRSRYVFIIINIAGITALGGLFNGTVPWLRHTITRASAATPIPHHLSHIEHTMFEDLWTITIPLLGVKFSVFDLPVIASTALFVLALWQYYCARRENDVVHIVITEALDIISESKECARYLYHGIAHYFVFTTYLDNNTPAGINATPESTWVVKALLFMPAWIPPLMVFSDFCTVCFPQLLGIDPSQKLWNHLGDSEKIEVYCRFMFGIMMAYFSYRLCRQALTLDTATRTDLYALKNKIDNPAYK